MPDEHVTFMRSQWRDLAAFAWKKYLTEGRGAVVVDLRKASKAESRLCVPICYVAERGKQLEAMGGWPNADLAETIQEYDPEQDVIFIFLRLDGDILHYNVSDELTPPQAYRQMQATHSD